MTTKPHANTRLAKYVAQRVAELHGRKTQAQIAVEAGFANANMITMIKSGATKLAIDRVPQLAKALECDTAYLLRLAMEQSLGEMAARAINEIYGSPVSENERLWIAEIRDASGDTDPRPTARSRTQLRAIFTR